MKHAFRSLRAYAAALTTVALVAVACGPGPTGGPQGPAEQAQKGGRIIEGSFSDIRTLAPWLVSDTPSDRIVDLLYESMLSADPNSGETQPGMAAVESSRDGLTHTFTINDKVNWSDGKPTIGLDFLTGVKAVAKSEKTVRKSLFTDVAGFNDYAAGRANDISGVKVDSANPKKVTVTLSRASCPAISSAQVAGYWAIPEHVFGKYLTDTAAKGAIDNAPEATNPQVTNGAFKFKEWRQGDQVVLVRNDQFWKGAPHVDEFVYKVVADQTVIAAQLKTGELNYGVIDVKDLADIERQEHLNVTKVKEGGYTYIGEVIKAVLFGEGVKQVAHHVPAQWAYPNPQLLNQYPYDRNKAESLLREAGYSKGADGFYAKDGKPISFTIQTNAGNKQRETLAQIASEQYKQIGVDAKTRFGNFQELVTKLTAGSPEIEAVIIGWSLGTEPDPYSIWHSSVIPDPAANRTGFGFTAFKSADLDRAIEQGRNPTNGDCSLAARKSHYETVNKILNEEQPYNFGYSRNLPHVTNKSLVNFKPGPFSEIHNIHEWWIRK
jgi:peptide/nickel transport system substrate-binding protein